MIALERTSAEDKTSSQGMDSVQIGQNEELTGMFSNASRLRIAKFAAKEYLLRLNL